MANTLLKLASSYIGTNVGISLDLPTNSSLVSGLATDRSGNIFVADTEQHTIYRIDPDGNTFVLAGSEGSAGYVNGVSAVARFNAPRGLAVDASGNLYVADTGNGKIRVIDIGLKVSTLAGGFTNITDVAVAPNGDVIAVDKGAHAVYRIESGGRKFLAAGGTEGDVYGVVGGVKKKGAAARFSSPEGVAVAADGKIYVTDTGNKKIKVIESDGYVNLVTGTVQGNLDGSAAVARLAKPTDIVIAPKGNRLFVLDKVNDGNRIKVVTLNGNVDTMFNTTTEDVIALTVDASEKIFCITADATGLVDGEQSSESTDAESSQSSSKSSIESSNSKSDASSASSASSSEMSDLSSSQSSGYASSAST